MADELTLTEAFEFFAQKSESEATRFADSTDTDIPNHGEALLVDDATDVLKTVTSARMSEEMAADGEDRDENAIAESIADSLVDVFASMATLKYERDIDITSAIEDRMDFIEDMEALNEALADAETEEETMAAMDEHLTEELEREMGLQNGPSVGDNVDREDYEHDEVDRTFQ